MKGQFQKKIGVDEDLGNLYERYHQIKEYIKNERVSRIFHNECISYNNRVEPFVNLYEFYLLPNDVMIILVSKRDDLRNKDGHISDLEIILTSNSERDIDRTEKDLIRKIKDFYKVAA